MRVSSTTAPAGVRADSFGAQLSRLEARRRWTQHDRIVGPEQERPSEARSELGTSQVGFAWMVSKEAFENAPAREVEVTEVGNLVAEFP